MEELKKLLEELLEETKKDYKLQDKEESEEAKQKVIDSLKETNRAIVYCGDGRTVLYGEMVAVLSSFCCILKRLKELVPEEIIKDCIKMIMEEEI